jgi:hypothetical protein
LIAPVACGGGAAETETAAPAAAEPEPEPVSEAGKSWNGWRWKGQRQECFFRHRNRCFDKLEAACRAAGCEGAQCAHDDAAPAVVSCRN